MTILEAPAVNIYPFENRDGETKYGFLISFEEQDEYYTPYLTNSREAIGLFVDPIEFAEIIQDMGSKYAITPNAIVFEDHASADIAVDALLTQLREFSIGTVEGHLYRFGADNYFGKKTYFIEQIAKRCGIEPEAVSDEELENEFETVLALQRGRLTIDAEDGTTHKAVAYDIAKGMFTTEDGTVIEIDDELSLTY